MGADPGQDFVRNALGKLYGRKPETVIVHTTFLGGSFGRKFLPDFVIHAARFGCGRQAGQVIRSREDDIRHGFYRPGVSGRFRAVLGEKGMPLAMHARLTGQSLYGVIKAERMAKNGGWDETMLEAIYDCVYRAEPEGRHDRREAADPRQLHAQRGFDIEHLHAGELRQRDGRRGGHRPVPYRRALLAHNPLALRTLDAAAGAAGWDRKPAANVSRAFVQSLHGRGRRFRPTWPWRWKSRARASRLP
jgi:isoquinoline 1-oxidoreductase beta subunit